VISESASGGFILCCMLTDQLGLHAWWFHFSEGPSGGFMLYVDFLVSCWCYKKCNRWNWAMLMVQA